MQVRSARTKSEPSQSLKAYQAIREAILNLELQPGDPLSEVEIAEQLGMSRTPVREAVRRLTSDGLVKSIPYKGAFVKAISKEEAREIYETAEGLEGMAAYLAAQNADEDDIERLRRAADAMEQAMRDENVDALIRADESYHAALHTACKNTHLVNSLDRLYEQVHRIRLMTARIRVDSAQSVQDHRATYDAVRSKDADRARSVTQRHWARIRRELLTIIP